MKIRYNSVLKGNSNSACNGFSTKVDHPNTIEENSSIEYTELNASNTNEQKSNTTEDIVLGVQYSSIHHCTSSTSKKEYLTNIDKHLVKSFKNRHSMNSIATQKQPENLLSYEEQRNVHTLPKKANYKYMSPTFPFP